MKTRLHCYRNRRYELRIDERGKMPYDIRDKLADMTLFEGTACWSLMDVRLAPERQYPSHLFGLNTSVLHASVCVLNDTERDYVQKILLPQAQSKVIEANGVVEVVWCTWQGLVPGQSLSALRAGPDLVYTDELNIFHRFKDAKAHMLQIQQFWNTFDGTARQAFAHKIYNPKLQTSEGAVNLALQSFRRRERLKARVLPADF